MNRKKEEIRKEMKKRRKGQLQQDQKRKSESLCQNIETSNFFKKSKAILFFAPSFGEPNILPLAEKYLHQKKICFPRVLNPSLDNKELEMTNSKIDPSFKAKNITSLSLLQKGSFGIPEPPTTLPDFPPEKIELVLLSALAIDKKGNRLGFGGGFYDRFLAELSVKKIAVIYGFQFIEEVPHDFFDIPVDGLVTENGLFLF